VFGSQSCPGDPRRSAGVLTMSHDIEFPAESKPVVLSDGRQHVVDEWGRRAGAALRSPAPENGASVIMRRARNQRTVRVGGALIGVLIVIAIGIAVLGRGDESQRPGDDTPAETVAVTELHDVNLQDALLLAQSANLPQGDHRWNKGQPENESERLREAAATIAALPACAVLTSVGLLPPTTKSAVAYQYVPGGPLLQDVFVYATPEDASRAMDVIASQLYPGCWFDVIDRGFEYTYPGTTSSSEAWQAPPIAKHGDRQVIIGQHTSFIQPDLRRDHYVVNAYVQVGRAISLIDPEFVATASDPLAAVDNDITAATTALKNGLGP
jgi:hypothetical protein